MGFGRGASLIVLIWYKKKHDITMTVTLNLPVENLKKSYHNKKEDHKIMHDKMKELANPDEIYTRKWLETKLKNKYGEHIFFC